VNNIRRAAYPEMTKLLASFPTLQQWDWTCFGQAFIFDKGPDGLRARYRMMCSASCHAVDLALEIYSHEIPWQKHGFHKFSLRHALATWDGEHRKAFISFVENPFLP